MERKLKATYSNNNAFTLIELAIVMVIIGLMVGGIIGAQSLINSSQISSQISQIRELNTAFNAFKLEYRKLPGDFDEAEDYWGDLGATCAGEEFSKTNTATCNGNGDNLYNTASEGYEWTLAWHHLYNAELINDFINYDINNDGSFYAPYIVARIEDNTHVGLSPFASSYTPTPTFTNAFVIAGGSSGEDSVPLMNTVKVRKVKSLDQKIDDGFPNSGNVQAEEGYIGGCTTAGTPPQWDVSDENLGCAVFVGVDF